MGRDQFLCFTLLCFHSLSVSSSVFAKTRRSQRRLSDLGGRIYGGPESSNALKHQKLAAKKNNSKAHKTWRPSCENHELTGNSCEQTRVSTIMNHVTKTRVSFHLWSFWLFFCLLCEAFVFFLDGASCHTQTSKNPQSALKMASESYCCDCVRIKYQAASCCRLHAAHSCCISTVSGWFSPEERFVPTSSSVSLISLFFVVSFEEELSSVAKRSRHRVGDTFPAGSPTVTLWWDPLSSHVQLSTDGKGCLI